MKKLNLKRYLMAHILLLGLFIFVELNVPSGQGLEQSLILGYVLFASSFSYFVLS